MNILGFGESHTQTLDDEAGPVSVDARIDTPRREAGAIAPIETDIKKPYEAGLQSEVRVASLATFSDAEPKKDAVPPQTKKKSFFGGFGERVSGVIRGIKNFIDASVREKVKLIARSGIFAALRSAPLLLSLPMLATWLGVAVLAEIALPATLLVFATLFVYKVGRELLRLPEKIKNGQRHYDLSTDEFANLQMGFENAVSQGSAERVFSGQVKRWNFAITDSKVAGAAGGTLVIEKATEMNNEKEKTQITVSITYGDKRQENKTFDSEHMMLVDPLMHALLTPGSSTLHATSVDLYFEARYKSKDDGTPIPVAESAGVTSATLRRPIEKMVNEKKVALPASGGAYGEFMVVRIESDSIDPILSLKKRDFVGAGVDWLFNFFSQRKKNKARTKQKSKSRGADDAIRDGLGIAEK